MYARKDIEEIIDNACHPDRTREAVLAESTLALAMLEYNKQYNDNEWPGKKE